MSVDKYYVKCFEYQTELLIITRVTLAEVTLPWPLKHLHKSIGLGC